MRGGLTFGMALLAGLGLAGCGADTGGKRPVSGTITLKGQLLNEGTINFAAKDSAGGFGGALIKDGKFAIPAQHGLTPGLYQVRISSPEKRALSPRRQRRGRPRRRPRTGCRRNST